MKKIKLNGWVIFGIILTIIIIAFLIYLMSTGQTKLLSLSK